MKKTIIIFIVILSLLSTLFLGCTSLTFTFRHFNSMNITSIINIPKDFTGVDLRENMNIKIFKNDNYKMKIKASKKLHRKIATEKIQDESGEYLLKISNENKLYDYLGSNKDIVIELYMPDLNIIKLSEGAVCEFYDFKKTDRLKIELNENSILKNSSVKVKGDVLVKLDESSCIKNTELKIKDEIRIYADESSSIEMKGFADDMLLDINNSSNANLNDFIVKKTETYINNNSKAKIFVEKKLTGKVSNNSILVYRGYPKTKKIEADRGSKIIKSE